MSVDLPEPDGPMTAVKRPRSKVDVDPGQRVHRGLAGAVGLAQVDGVGGGGRLRRRRWVLWCDRHGASSGS